MLICLLKFLARLVKSRAPRTSIVVIGDSEVKGPEIGSRSVPPVSDVVGEDVVLAKDRKMKLHRDGNISRSHHSKKFRKRMTFLNSNEFALFTKVGAESCAHSATGVETSDEPIRGGLLLCKNYAEKVYSVVVLFISSFVCRFLLFVF